MAIALAALFLVVAALGTGLRFYMGRNAKDRLQPGDAVAITALRGPLPSNAFVACPSDYCAVTGAMASPVFAVPVSRLVEDWQSLIAAEPRIVPVSTKPGQRSFVLIQHSAFFWFPDIISVEFVSLGPDRSSIALYSRPRYGRADFGVNRRRVERWLSRLRQSAGATDQN